MINLNCNMTLEEMVWESIEQIWDFYYKNDYPNSDNPDNKDILQSSNFENHLGIRDVKSLRHTPFSIQNLILKPESPNVIGMAQLLSAFSKLYSLTGDLKFRSSAYRIAELLAKSKCDGYSGFCWGNNYDWQSEAFFLPEGTPSLVTSVMVGNSLFDAHEIFDDPELLKIALSVVNFISDDIYRTPFEDTICFAYSPLDKSLIHDANMMGAAYLSRASGHTHSHEHEELAYRSMEFSLSFQRPDGSWYYGVSPSQKWIDSFHGGILINALRDYIKYSSRFELESNLIRAAGYYTLNLITDDGIPKYSPNDVYPVDIHSCSQAIITLGGLTEIIERYSPLLDKCLIWTLDNMKEDNAFGLWKNRAGTNTQPSLVWSQAWMLSALTIYLRFMQNNGIARPSEEFRGGYRIIFEENGFSFEKVNG
ncbi:MAG: hypothetical protein GY855_01845 [candidate division Zixibacteria bacterium]|nr:hypothetical protein [candidate division Zixibacteria bacterium]